MASPWTFGWTQLLTIIGLFITSLVALGGFRTFGRWKREKIEEKRIDTAVEALAFVYESKFIFDHIRGALSLPYEWNDMPDGYGPEEQRRARGPFYAILRRIDAQRDFFERAWKVQTLCTALFGSEAEEAFLMMHRSRRAIEVAAETLLHNPEPPVRTQDNVETWDQFRADIWPEYGRLAKDGDKVGRMLTEFKTKIEGLCRPIIDREYGKQPPKAIAGRIADWLGMS